MPTLLDPPSPEQLRLLQVITDGWIEAREQWPVWQYVTMRLNQEELNADEIYLGLPTWQHGYRPVFRFESGSVPNQGERIGLTVHGLVHAPHAATGPLLGAFLHILAAAQRAQLEIVPSALALVPMKQEIPALLQRYDLLSTRPPSGKQLAEVLSREPATWSGIDFGSQHTPPNWDLSNARLQTFKDATSGQEYLIRLEGLVGVSRRDAGHVALSPLALPEAFDHLDLAWRLMFGSRHRLVRVPRASVAGQLTQPVNSREEFQARCSALSDLLSCMDVPQGELDAASKPLVRLQAELRRTGGEDADLAIEAVHTLRRVAHIRNGQQHAGAVRQVDRDWVALGLPRFDSDWSGAWHRVCVVTVEALTTIRETIVSQLDGKP